jgi:LPS-assembly protein
LDKSDPINPLRQSHRLYERLARYVCLLLLISPYLASGEDLPSTDQWELCTIHGAPHAALTTSVETTPDGTTVLSADEAEILNQDTVLLRGDIQARQNNQYLRADSATYQKTTDQLHAQGNIEYSRKDLSVNGNNADISLNSNTGTLNDTSYELFSRHAHGVAKSITLENEDITVLQDVTYTTCDIDDNTWLLRSHKLRLNQTDGVGAARNVVLTFEHVPFFYFPYITFPIDDRRKSGFLPPSYGHSSDNGTEVTIPYYLNIAPQFDATLAPRLISRRGAMINSEFRYLTTISHGQLNLEYLPNDKLAGENRNLVQYRDNASYSNRLSSEIQIAHVSDTEYFRELGNSLSISSITNLRQFATLNYQKETWNATALLENYQTVDETISKNARPYQRFPQILFLTQKPEEDWQINYNFTGEYVDFRNDDRISGSRIDLQPNIAFPMRSPGAFLLPTLTMRNTTYALDENSAVDTHPSRTLPILSIDSGVFFERDTTWGQQSMIHTLEPRLYYLYAPQREQSDIPLFDTGIPDFTFSQLFRNNRFNGSDRVGDANQLSAALTTRFFEKDTGQERLRASIGRIYYFQDREVGLKDEIDTTKTSPIVAEAIAKLTPTISTKIDLRWDDETRRFDRESLRFQYMPGQRSIFNIAYLLRDPTLEQTDISFIWPLSRQWHVIGRRYYSLLDRRPLETLAGFEYQSCCWRTQIVNRRYVNDDLGETRESLYIQFELKGLTSIGDSIESVLENGILGYEN